MDVVVWFLCCLVGALFFNQTRLVRMIYGERHERLELRDRVRALEMMEEL